MKSTMRRSRPEQQIQRAVFEHLALRGAPAMFAFHPANGGWRSRVEAAILKGMGVRAGLPDIIAVKDGQCYALELKASDGCLTSAQRDAHAALAVAGATVAVAYGLAMMRSPGWRPGSCCAARARDACIIEGLSETGAETWTWSADNKLVQLVEKRLYRALAL